MRSTATRHPDAPVEIRGLRKRFGALTALDGLDLDVPAGAVTGFLGPNGAGKSTVIRILLGLLRADAGSVRLFGADPWADAVALHRRLAYVPGDVTLWPGLTGGEVLDLLTRLRGGVPARRRADLLARFELDPTKRCRTYSTGNRQKVALVAALSADVDLLVLDEPTSGLDPLMEAVFAQCIREARARGQAVLLSSHILAEVEQLADTVTIIRAGRTVTTGTLAELRHLTRTSIRAETHADPAALAQARDPRSLAARPGVHDVQVDGHMVSLSVEAGDLDAAIAALAALGLRSLVASPPSLEELFLSSYRRPAPVDATTAGQP